MNGRKGKNRILPRKSSAGTRTRTRDDTPRAAKTRREQHSRALASRRPAFLSRPTLATSTRSNVAAYNPHSIDGTYTSIRISKTMDGKGALHDAIPSKRWGYMRIPFRRDFLALSASLRSESPHALRVPTVPTIALREPLSVAPAAPAAGRRAGLVYASALLAGVAARRAVVRRAVGRGEALAGGEGVGD